MSQRKDLHASFCQSNRQFLIVFLFVAVTSITVATAQGQRVDRGQIAFYDFRNNQGDLIKDNSGIGDALDLRIDDLPHVSRANGALTIHRGTKIQSVKPATKLIDSLKRTGEISIEAWLQPANTSQDGPARIVTLSTNTMDRNFTLGQEKNAFQVRLRTNRTDSNGFPTTDTRSGSVKTSLQHIVFARRKNGTTTIHINGKQQAKSSVSGDFKVWNRARHFALANEITGDRPWLGTLHLVAIYDRALSESEIKTNFSAGVANRSVVVAPKPKEPSPQPIPPSVGNRVAKGLQALYQFDESDGNLVRDQSGSRDPNHLTIASPKTVRRQHGTLTILGKSEIRSSKPASSLIRSIKRSNEISIEAWVRPENTKQDGPARIVTISKDGSNRNATLGQDGNKYIVRLRTTSTSTNGIPSADSKSKVVKTQLAHLIYTRSRTGTAKLFIDGQQVLSKKVGGDLRNWDSNYRLALADELSGGRVWKGTYHLVAIYSRSLNLREIKRNFRAGPNGKTESARVQIAKSPNTLLFEHSIAPLFAKHCLECHDSATHQGGLNLSRKATAFAESDSGKPIVPKDHSKSLVWDSVQNDEMPLDRPPLSDSEKQILKNWIDRGAEWSIDFIDPAVYMHQRRTNDNWVRRLTVSEYIATVRSTLGIDIEAQAREMLPKDMRADGFSNTAYNLNVDLAHVDAYAKLSRIAVNKMDPRSFAKRFRGKLSLTDNDMRGLISEMGKWVLRGPLDEEEVVLYRGVSTSVASAGGNLDQAIAYVLQAMLQSPRFLYRIENQRGDGEAWQVGEYELASRMSYILWGSSPDKELYSVAEQGGLYDPDIARQQVKRMLDDPRAVKQSLEFVSQWLNLDRMDNMQPNQKRFPKWNTSLARDMKSETLAFTEEVLWKQKRPVADLLNAQVTFLSPALAKHYGLDSSGDGQRRYDLKSVPSRGGLMTQGSVLTVGGDDASMVTRGLLVMHELLRGVVKDPPPCVDTTPVPSEPGTSQRAIAEARIKNESCGGCHGKFEPLAFGMEKFDGLGAFHHRDEHGNALREDGKVLIPGESESKAYKTSAELMNLLAASNRVKESLTWKVTQFALGRPLLAADAPIVRQIHQSAQKNGGTYQAIVSAIVLSDLVQTSQTEAE